MENSQLIFLVGFMGSGKTTLGKKLATKLSYSFLDLDKEIQKRENCSIPALIEAHGFEYFREKERAVLQSLDIKEYVVSTGGGTPCFFDNMDWMLARGTVVYLDVYVEVIVSRLKKTNFDERPMLKNVNPKSIREFVEQTLAERLPYYQKADIFFNSIMEKPEDLAAKLGI